MLGQGAADILLNKQDCRYRVSAAVGRTEQPNVPNVLPGVLAVTRQICEAPNGVENILQAPTGLSRVPIDEGNWHALPKHHIVRTGVAVYNHFIAGLQLTPGSRIVETPQEFRSFDHRLIAEGVPPMRYIARNER